MVSGMEATKRRGDAERDGRGSGGKGEREGEKCALEDEV